MSALTFYVLFNLGVLAALVADLGIFNRKAHAPSVKEASLTSLFWVAVSIAFGIGVWHFEGPTLGIQWFTAYTMEKALSVDNLFVFSLIFGYFKIDPKYRHKVLFWGILGAIVMRTGMLLAGVTLVQTFHWLLYIFGVFLLYTGVKMILAKGDDEADVENSMAVRIVRKLGLPVINHPRAEGKFWVRLPKMSYSMAAQASKINRQRFHVTTLFLALVAVEISDVVFAVDSVPVVLAVTQDFMVAYTATIMAILGLRSLFFVLEHLLSRLRYLPLALGFILAFIGGKMLIADFFHIPVGVSLAVVLATLTLATVASVLNPETKE